MNPVSHRCLKGLMTEGLLQQSPQEEVCPVRLLEDYIHSNAKTSEQADLGRPMLAELQDIKGE